MERSLAISEIANVIAELPLPHPIRVAVDGRDGAGKTMLANEFVRPLQALGREVIRASVDDFHNPRAIRYLRGRDSAEGCFRDTFNYDALHDVLLEPLGPGGSREYRTAAFDWRDDAPVVSPLRRASDDAIVIVDGVFLLRPELIGFWDFKIFVDVSVQVGVGRTAARHSSSPNPDADSNRRYIEAQKLYFTACNPVSEADVVFDNNNLAEPELAWRL